MKVPAVILAIAVLVYAASMQVSFYTLLIAGVVALILDCRKPDPMPTATRRTRQATAPARRTKTAARLTPYPFLVADGIPVVPMDKHGSFNFLAPLPDAVALDIIMNDCGIHDF